MAKAEVISLAEEREKRRQQKKKQCDDALTKLLLGVPLVEKATPKKRVRGVIPFNPDDVENFNQGFSEGRAGERYSPKPRKERRGPKTPGAGYGCGYLNGIFWRELSENEDEGLAVDWHRS